MMWAYVTFSPWINAVLRPLGFTMWGTFSGDPPNVPIKLVGLRIQRNRF
jgi:hypothetical protein